MESALFREAGVRVGELLGAGPAAADGRGRSSCAVEWREDCEALELTPSPAATRTRGGVLRLHCVYNAAFRSPMLLYQLRQGQDENEDKDEANAETDGSSSGSARGGVCGSGPGPGLGPAAAAAAATTGAAAVAAVTVDHPVLGDPWLCLSPCGLISAPTAYTRTSTSSRPPSTCPDEPSVLPCTPLWLPLAQTTLLLLSAVCRDLPLGLDMVALARAAAVLHRLE